MTDYQNQLADAAENTNIQFQRNVKTLGIIAALIGLLALTYATDGVLPGVLLSLGIVGALYFLPTICANSNRHHNRDAILVLNLLLGWTLIGWVAAMVWACTTSVAVTTAAAPAPKAADPRWQNLRAGTEEAQA